MELCVAVRAPLDRWALVRSLGVEPSAAMDLVSARARLLHPTGTVTDLVLIVRDQTDEAWLRALLATTPRRRRPTVVAIVAETADAGVVERAGADVVVPWDSSGPLPGPRVLSRAGRARAELLVLPDQAAAPA